MAGKHTWIPYSCDDCKATLGNKSRYRYRNKLVCLRCARKREKRHKTREWF